MVCASIDHDAREVFVGCGDVGQFGATVRFDPGEPFFGCIEVGQSVVKVSRLVEVACDFWRRHEIALFGNLIGQLWLRPRFELQNQ